MTNGIDRNLELDGGLNPASERKRQTNIAPELVARARDAEFGLPPADAYAAAAMEAQMISDAQIGPVQTADGSYNVVPINPQAAASQAKLLARPAHEINLSEAA